MEALITTVYILLFIFIIHRMKFFNIEGLSKTMISVVFILKILTGFVLWLIYTYYYTDRKSADIFKYFDDGNAIYQALLVNPWHYLQLIFGIDTDAEHLNQYYQNTWNWFKPRDTQVYNDNRSIIRFNAIVRLVSFGYYQVHNVFMNFLSLAGLTAVYKTFQPHLANKRKELLFAVFLMPSVILWGSGVLKEGLLLFAMGLFFYHFMKLSDHFSAKSLFWVAIFSFLIILSKFYIIIAFGPAMLAYLWVKKTNGKNVLLKYIVIYMLFVIPGINLHHFSSTNNALEMMVRKQTDFISLADSLDSGSRFNIPKLEPNAISFIKNSPQALFNTLTRPHILEAKNPFMIMAAAENALIAVVILLSIFFFQPAAGNRNILALSLAFVIVLFILIGLATPVMGALVRYKAPALPFLFIIFLMTLDKEKLLEKLPFLKFLK